MKVTTIQHTHKHDNEYTNHQNHQTFTIISENSFIFRAWLSKYPELKEAFLSIAKTNKGSLFLFKDEVHKRKERERKREREKEREREIESE